MHPQDCIVIWAGQSGLSAAYYLRQAGLEMTILDKQDRIGDIWRERYDSLRLFSPRFCNQLPGEAPMPGRRNSYPPKDEFADYLEAYAAKHQFPLQTSTEVQHILPTDQGYQVSTTSGSYPTRSLIFATWGFNQPKQPAFASDLPDHIYQIHSSQYKNPDHLSHDWAVVVVGWGNSGVQIARELSLIRPVHFVYDQMHRWFTNYWIIWWIADKLWLLTCKTNSLAARLIRKDQKEPVIWCSRDLFFSTDNLIDCGTIISVDGEDRICDKQRIDGISSIVRATWYQQDRSWTGLDGLTDDQGDIIESGWVTPLPGIYVLWLPWMRQKWSATIGWVHKDAEVIVDHLIDYLHVPPHATSRYDRISSPTQ